MAASSGQTALNIGKARLEKSVPVNGWTSSGMAGEHKVRLQTHSVIRSSYGRLESFKPICKERLSWCTAAILVGCLPSGEWGRVSSFLTALQHRKAI